MPSIAKLLVKKRAIFAAFALFTALPACVATAHARARAPVTSSTCDDLTRFQERFDDEPNGAPCTLEDPKNGPGMP